METKKTLGQVLIEAISGKRDMDVVLDAHICGYGELDESDAAIVERIAAAVVQAHEAAQLMTWDEAMKWATEDGEYRYVLGYCPERFMWFMMSPETGYGNSGRFFTGHRHVWSRGELTHFRRLPEPPKEGR